MPARRAASGVSSRGTEASSAAVYGCARRGEQFAGGRRLDDASRVHDRDAVGDARHDADVVRDQHDGESAVARPAQHVDHLRLHGDVECRGRLVRHQQRPGAS